MTAAAMTLQRKLVPPLRRGWGWVAAQRANPVLVRDLRALFRGRRLALTQVGYLLVLAVSMGIAAMVARSQHAMYGFQGVRAAPEYGKWMFNGLFETQVVLVLLVAVAYSASAISLEREKQTYDVLAMTSLRSAEVVLGKVWSVSLLCWLLLLTAMPLAAICVFFGGISPGEMALAYGLLALKVPLWAALGVLASVLTGRSVNAYVTALFAVGLENSLSVFLTNFNLNSSPTVSPGLFSPFVSPVASDLTFTYVNWPIWPWVLPTLYTALLTAFIIVGSAEAMDHYRPRRSRAFRGLLLAITFFLAAVVAGSALQAAGSHRGASFPLGGAIIVAWIWACAFVPIFTSYPPPANSEGERPDRLALQPERWLDRHPVSGGGFCVMLWLTALLGMFLPLLAAQLTGPPKQAFGPAAARPIAGLSPLPHYFTDTPALALAVAIGLLGLMAYAAWGSVLALVHKARREAGLGALLLILMMNAFAVVYSAGYAVMRRPPSAAVLVLTSPVGSMAAVLAQHNRASDFARYSLDEAVVFGLAYPLLLLAGAWWYYDRAQRRGWASTSPSVGEATAVREKAEEA